MAQLSVIGAGSYGTSLALVFAKAGHSVSMWCHEAELAERMQRTRENDIYLPGFALPPGISVSSELAEVVDGADIVLGVTPTHAVRKVLGEAAGHLSGSAIVVNCSKGLEEGTLGRVDEIYRDILPPHVYERAVYLSGPTFAKELAAGLPAALVVASRDADSAASVQHALSTDRLRLYTAPDVVGVLIGGALKNVVAIAAGMSDGMGLGLNARAAIITRGLAELTRLGTHVGADPLTFAGLSGMGDLVLTCSGDLSRNRQVGLALGAGKKRAEIVAEMRMVAEGVNTTRVARALAERLGVEAPITEVMHRVLFEDLPASAALADLTGRALRSERA
ncbi:NAD(P)H-dependent glycerol-3-phosphate dehydrogenase [Haliangium ochraceum]|uniref:Glycerol-3-phosphate dehydrogenase [NAD(P)+] n=1 Tax=Haliangium ochraceum (strain DSM 14365 / JCM 11303 / SMP-2) TaxID=502025 RepID=D0LJH5_HALO1|nr:NAD(P)H-dependent glycerol-3-phosphate dehydrogenase [Haliangium ochraceum]ACY16549.1 Glycerol-3-phosphate dehydrogenase (NAD(P)(+)) [Haliangium ochraceum DSM 14365]